MNLTYDNDRHEYKIDGNKVVGVNDILVSVGIKREYKGDPYYGMLGTFAAEAIELWIKGVLDESTVDEAIKPRLEAFKKWASDVKYSPIECEGMRGDPLRGIAGRFDHLGRTEAKGLVLIDTKCVNTLDVYGTDCQLALYDYLIRANNETTPEAWLALQLKADGTYFEKYLEPDEAIALSILNLYERKMSHKVKK